MLQAIRLAFGTPSARLGAGLDLTLDRREKVAVMGPSGAGKTTLLRTLATLIDPYEGELLLDGRTPSEVGWPRWRRQILYVAQEPALLPGTVEDNLRRPFAYGVARAHYDAGRAREELEALGVPAAKLEQEGARASVGERQRICLVRALLLSPRALLLDEPTSALDRASAGAVEQRLGAFVEAGGACLVVTHDLEQAARLCDRTISIEGPANAESRPTSIGGTA